MRQIFLDTETTGLYSDQGHRVIEVAAVEAFNRRLTGNHFHYYLNPERDIDEGAQAVHGITSEFLQDKPLFESIAEELSRYIEGAEVVIHNAPFDVGFLNMEYGRLGLQPVQAICDKITDTLKMAKDMRPGQRNNLDALCRHFGVDNTKRTLHGALLDAELLAEVYMAMTRGQESLIMDLSVSTQAFQTSTFKTGFPPIKRINASDEELAAHKEYLEGLAKAGATSW